ncbi:MAG: GTP 3',8-cyclase MoaA [Crocinitomicaceae bacterium]|nr:GTP 3',8-cyclase MoaA [Crocinitomicaceae bacterium]
MNMNRQILTDKFGRKHDYLRISLLERCNLRCHYCMPEEGVPLRDKEEFMSQEELFAIADSFINLGIKKVRLTGGEPLIKKNFAEIISFFASKDIDLAITTNGILLDQYWDQLKSANLSSLNISLDSLVEEKFNRISRRNYFERIYKNILEAIDRKFNVKINVVLIKGENDDEIIDFIELTKDLPITVRFIEFMPFDGNQWDWSRKVSFKEILNRVKAHYQTDPISYEMEKNGTARNFKIQGYLGEFGIISSITNPFCDSCNRIRLTADGKIKNCLFSAEETDLLSAFRRGEDIIPLIHQSIGQKHKSHAGLKPFDSEDFSSENRMMTTIGG